MTLTKATRWDNSAFPRKTHISDQDKQAMADYLRVGLNMGKPRDELLEELGTKYHRSTRQVERYIAQCSPSEQEQKPYKETPHKQKMRELAKAIAERISVPSHWDGDWVRDLPLEFNPGKYALSIGVVEISQIDEDTHIKVHPHKIDTGVVAPHLIKGLYSHLSTSKQYRFAELVGDNGIFDNWVRGVGQYFEIILGFLKLIADDVKGHKVRIGYRDEAKPKSGLTRWFILSIWSDAIRKAGGYTWIDDSWYHPPENIPDTSLWQGKCGSYGIGIARSKRTLKMYDNLHKELRVNYAEHQSAKDIHAKSQELSNIAQEIRQRLLEFSDMERVPGHCELC